MQFRVLGPLEAIDDGLPVPIGSPMRKAMLGFLLLHANTVVAASQVIRALWLDAGPPTARQMLHNTVSGLRRVLSSRGATLSTNAPGYVLRVDPEQVDLAGFRRLAGYGRASLAKGDWAPATDNLRAAMALWRGPALADLVEKGTCWPELTAVQNERLATLEDLYEAELALGRHREVISELELLTDTEPLRERLCGQLMLALYRCGRQADALGAYRRAHSALSDQLGLQPGHDLRRLSLAIVDQHPVLSAYPCSCVHHNRTQMNRVLGSSPSNN